MAGLVGQLHGQQLEDLAVVGMDPADEAGGDEQGRLLVLDQVGHELDHGQLDLGRVVDAGGPVDRRGRVPLPGGGLGVELGRHLRPHGGSVRQVGLGEWRPAGLDQGAAGGQAPGRVGPLGHRTGGQAGPGGAVPTRRVGRALDDGLAVAGVAVGPRPRLEVDGQVQVPTTDVEPVAGLKLGEGSVHEEVGALVEAEILKVDSRRQ